MKFQRILVPVDFSGSALKVLDTVDSLAREFGAELDLVHVVESSPYQVYQQRGIVYGNPEYVPAGTGRPTRQEVYVIHDLVEETRTQLQSLVRDGWKAKVTVRNGPVMEELLEEMREFDADLVVMATHGWTGFKHMLLGSVAEKMVRMSPAPVLTLRIPGE